MNYLWAIGSVIVVSLLSFIGILTLALRKERLNKILFFLISLAIGGLLGGAFFHLIPEGFEEVESEIIAPLAIVLGLVIFLLIEKFLHWHHCHRGDCQKEPRITLAYMNLVGDAFHNLLDGVIIGVSFLVSIPIGIAATVAVILHEIPQEISDFGVLVYGGLKIRTALLLNFLSALFAILGVVVALVIGPAIESIIPYVLLFAAGGFIYIAGSDLIPEIRKEVSVKKSLFQLFGIALGIGLMMLLLFLE
jgi:zinc and cadmium transporter